MLALPADVTEPDAPQRLVEATVERFGALDILVGNAGGPPKGRALEVDDVTLLAAIDANLLTSVRLVREAVPHMRAAGWGRICLDRLELGEATHPGPRHLEHRPRRPLGMGEDRRAGPDR